MLQCLTNIVGITNSECECIVGGLTVDQIATLKLSTSGLYMDNLPGGVHLKSLTRMDSCKSLYEMALNARDTAVKNLEDDLVIAINTRYKKDKKQFKGQIGRMSYAQSLAVSNGWQALQIRPVDSGNTLISIKKIDIILNQSIPIVVKLFRAPYNTVVGEEINSWNVTTVANSYKTIDIGTTPINLPVVYNNQVVEYYLAYDLTGTTAAPKDNGIVCLPCNGGISGYEQYIEVNGAQFNSPGNLGIKATDSYTRGFILDVSLFCDNTSLFCDAYDNDDAIAVTMANAVWFKSGELLIEAVNKQPDISRYTTMAKEYLWGKRNHFRKEYEDRIRYMEMSIDISDSNCYVCRETANQPSLHTILL